MNHDEVLRERLARQRLTGPPAASPVAVVRELLAIQAQDAQFAQAMIAVRAAARTSDVRAAIDSGAIVRTHVLRPTWHYVAAEDLAWLLALTAPKIESGMASRHRQLGLSDPATLDAALAVVAARVAGHNHATRAEIGAALAADGVLARGQPLFGQQLGHVLMLAELRGVICSGPLRGGTHTYALVAERIRPGVALPPGTAASMPDGGVGRGVGAPPPIPPSREAAITELTRRFIVSHGPVALADLLRWTTVTLGEARAACRELDCVIERVEVAGHELWRARDLPAQMPAFGAHVLSVFDEACLSYRVLGFPRTPGHPWGPTAVHYAQSSNGPVLYGGQDVGIARRRGPRESAQRGTSEQTRGVGRRGVAFTYELDPALGADARTQIEAAGERVTAALTS